MSERVNLSALKMKKSPKKETIKKITPVRKTDVKMNSPLKENNILFSKKGFLLLSLSISAGIFIFVICIYFIYLIYNSFFASSQTDSDENLDFLDELEEVEETKEEEELAEETNKEKEEL